MAKETANEITFALIGRGESPEWETRWPGSPLCSTGAALGNLVCIANIVAVAAVLGLEKAEVTILRLTLPPSASSPSSPLS